MPHTQGADAGGTATNTSKAPFASRHPKSPQTSPSHHRNELTLPQSVPHFDHLWYLARLLLCFVSLLTRTLPLYRPQHQPQGPHCAQKLRIAFGDFISLLRRDSY